MVFKLEGYDTFEGESYPLEGEYQTEQEAVNAARQRLKQLEIDQPSDSSGGQHGGIQDRVYVIHPNGNRIRVS